MNIFALPGINPKTERWAANLVQEIVAPDQTFAVQRYKHWDCDECLNLPEEVERLRGMSIDLLIAKSMGVMVGLIACGKGLISPQRFVGIGTPVIAFDEDKIDLRQLVSDLAVPGLFIQQTSDIVGSCARLRQAIDGLPMVGVVEIPGENHQYKDLKLLARHIRRWA
jgi:hypothetical protein